MRKPLLSLDGVAKVYPRVHRPGERMRAFGQLFLGREPTGGAEVLSDIDLEVHAGQSLGIIGENGAGKSTLLKVLTGVIQPTRGEVAVRARTSALLELGAGFQPEFSGLENVRMNAALLGLSRAEIDERLDEILDFADIGEYIYEPVKHYSSGMVVRLGFAVVTASRPELLITDEVLAVGDESFQKKCIRWIEDFLSEGGTLLMVSHSMYVIQKLCQRALWLKDGQLQMHGDVFPVTQAYLAWHEQRTASEKQQQNNTEGREGYYHVTDFAVAGEKSVVNTATGDPECQIGEALLVSLELYSPDGRVPAGHVGIVRADGTPVYGISTDVDGAQAERVADDRFLYRLRFDDPGLLPGSYSVRGHALDPEGLRLCDTTELRFMVTGETRELGFVRLPHRWE